jgi:uncharacterized protein YjiS (DUF1127 family)
MDPRLTKEDLFLSPARRSPAASATAEQIEAIRLAAVRARDEAMLARLGRLGTGIAAFVVGLARSAADIVERRRAYAALSRLTDHELADIGLLRGELHRVLKPGSFRRDPAPPTPVVAAGVIGPRLVVAGGTGQHRASRAPQPQQPLAA